MPDGRLLKELDLEIEDIADMTEPEYRANLLRHHHPLNEPVYHAIEDSIGRQRERLEEFYQTESGQEKWCEIADEVLPMWAEVLSEFEHRENYVPEGHLKHEEKLYRESLNERFQSLAAIKGRLSHNPVDQDIQLFAEEYRGLENVYDEEVKEKIETTTY